MLETTALRDISDQSARQHSGDLWHALREAAAVAGRTTLLAHLTGVLGEKCAAEVLRERDIGVSSPRSAPQTLLLHEKWCPEVEALSVENDLVSAHDCHVGATTHHCLPEAAGLSAVWEREHQEIFLVRSNAQRMHQVVEALRRGGGASLHLPQVLADVQAAHGCAVLEPLAREITAQLREACARLSAEEIAEVITLGGSGGDRLWRAGRHIPPARPRGPLQVISIAREDLTPLLGMWEERSATGALTALVVCAASEADAIWMSAKRRAIGVARAGVPPVAESTSWIAESGALTLVAQVMDEVLGNPHHLGWARDEPHEDALVLALQTAADALTP